MDINLDLIKWVVLILGAPIWWPFVRDLWKDFNGALREEGGLLGSPPPRSEMERIRREKESEPEMLVSEPWARTRGGQRTRPAPGATRAGKTSGKPAARGRPAPRPAPGPRRFR